MSLRHARVPFAAATTVSLVIGFAVAGSAGATTPVAPISTPVDTAIPTWEPAPIEWTELSPGLEEGFVEVPIDYAHPDGGTLRLYVARSLALDADGRVGSLFVNPGGPGFGG